MVSQEPPPELSDLRVLHYLAIRAQTFSPDVRCTRTIIREVVFQPLGLLLGAMPSRTFHGRVTLGQGLDKEV